MSIPVRIDKELLDKIDSQASRLGFTRQNLTNNLLRIITSYLEANDYEKTLKLHRSKHGQKEPLSD